MQRYVSLMGAGAIALGLGLTSIAPVQAMPMVAIVVGPAADIQQVGHRDDWRRRHRHWRGYEHRRYYGERRHSRYERRHRPGAYWEYGYGRWDHRRHGYRPRFGFYFD